MVVHLFAQLGAAMEEAVKAIAHAFDEAIDEVADFAKDVWGALEKCAQETANSLAYEG